MLVRPSGESADQRREHGAIGPVQPRAGVGPAQHGDLVPQHQQFDVLGGGGAPEECRSTAESSEDQVQQSWRHVPRSCRRGASGTITAGQRPSAEFVAPRRSSTTPQQALDLLEIAWTFDPHNELICRDIMRLQERLGQLDAIPRTLTLLTSRLAEVDDRPTPRVISLADRLRHRDDTTADTLQQSGTDRRDTTRHDTTG
ncbi:hypothetical protein [Saccharothrix yanglingensis]|uniref:hypothetical protein n=1 Tax=Saccharothrix yanglingensis TaxID=659496 RepID=UPI0027D2D163|nr:hypothetical protein [Saccharothrix yanglingensis]